MSTGNVEIGNLVLESGKVLERVRVAYERVGRHDSPTVLVCQPLSNHNRAVSTGNTLDWWSGLIGPGKSIDTNKVSVITFKELIHSQSKELYGKPFPEVTIRDMVNAERKALTKLGANRLRAVIGGSHEGKRVFEWGMMYPEHMDILFPIAATPAIEAWGSIEKAANRILAKVIAIAFTDDLVCPAHEIRSFVHRLYDSTFYLIHTQLGHEGYTEEIEKWELIIKQSMEVVKCRQSKSLYSASAL